MKKYANIVFMQESEADEAMTIYYEQGNDALLTYLKQWDNGEYTELLDRDPGGEMDWTTYIGDYIINVNMRLPYVGLTKIIKED